MTTDNDITTACQARIDTSALRHNYVFLKQKANGAKVMALLKANAYGHGLLQTANALADADAFGVARLDEAISLRDAGFNNRIVILGGVQKPQEWRIADRLKLDLVIHQEQQLQACMDFCSGLDSDQTCGFNLWLKFDTGMHRLGFPIQSLQSVKNSLDSVIQHFAQPVVVMSHLANADDLDDPFNQAQIAAYRSIENLFKSDVNKNYEFALANSGALLGNGKRSLDWVRPGIALFGIAPFAGKSGKELGLKPVMTLESRIISIKRVVPGDGVGYGQTWVADKSVLIGIASIGYGDGYPWHAKNGTPVLVDGQTCQLAGRVSMDLIAIDISNAPQAKIGSCVTLWGNELPVETVAQHAQCIPYVLVCGITHRVQVNIS
jgi:alanine racemase